MTRTPARSRLATGALSLALALSACEGLPFSPDDDKVCTADFRWGLIVDVRDQTTGEPAGADATVRAQSDRFSELLQPTPPDAGEPLTFYGLGERPGTYDVTVTREGYATWRADDVRLGHDGCHVIPVRLQAELVPQD